MSTNEVLQTIWEVATVADQLFIVMALGYVAVLSVGGLVLLAMRRWVLAAVCFGLAGAPYLMHWGIVARQNEALASRAAEVAGFTRTPLTSDYPRVLEVQAQGVASLVMPWGWFDEVHVTGTPFSTEDDLQERLIHRWIDSPQCAAMAEAIRTARRHFELPDNQTRDACISEVRGRVEDRPDAVILLEDHHTSLRRPRGTHHMNGARELRVRRRGRDVLVDYWETPYVERPRSPFLGQRLLETRSEPPEKRSMFAFLQDNLPGAEENILTR
jgi:hypothetical protein